MSDKLSSIKKTIIILNCLSVKPYEYKASELSNITGINRTTVHRILEALKEDGLVIKDMGSKKYRLGPSIYRMGSVYLHNVNFENKILETLTKISEESKESAGLAIRDNETIISLYEIELFQSFKMNYKPGIFYPMNRGCYGKCLMAYYDQERVRELLYSQKFEKVCTNTLTDPEEILKEYKEIRENGYVISDEETFRYAVGVGIPIFDSKSEVIACVAISFLKQNNYIEKIENLKEILFKYSDEISKHMP